MVGEHKLAVIVASYAGAKHLSRLLVCTIIFMYAFYTAVFFEASVSHVGYLDALYGQLAILSESAELTLVGQYAIDNSSIANRVSLLSPFVAVAFFVTIGFVVYAYKKMKKAD